jgi:sigma-B regulation protein RsbU (phosphoserine phosphatase)
LILIVDDDAKNIKLVDALLRADNYEVAAFTSGRQAVESIGEIHPDLILLDVMMPGMSGKDVCKKLKSDKATKDIPLIFLTARSEAMDIIGGFQAGAVDFISKPFHSAELLARVRAHVELKIARDKQKLDLLHARSIQQRMLSARYKDITCLRIALKYLPIDEVGGDVYDITETRPGHVRVFLADAAGHGVQAALLSMLIKSDYEKMKLRLKHPDQLLQLLNREIIATYKTLTVVFPAIIVDIDAENRGIVYCSAGFPTQYYRPADGGVRELRQSGPMLGVGVTGGYDVTRMSVEAGGKLFLFTDGLHGHLGDAAGGDESIVAVLGEHGTKPIQEIVDVFTREMEVRAGSKSDAGRDDVTLVVVEVL